MTTSNRLALVYPFFTALLALAFNFQPNNDLADAVGKIAAEFKKGNDVGATKLAKAAAKNYEDVGDLMRLFRPVNKGGLGLDARLKKANVGNAQQVGNLTAAMAEVMLAKPPLVRNAANGNAKNAWAAFAIAMRKDALDLAKAKNAAAVTAALTKITNSCNACHTKFKD